MTETGHNLYVLDRMMNVNSLSQSAEGAFGVTLSNGFISMEQADLIITRSDMLHKQMSASRDKIYELYGQEPTDRLMRNFSEIISYSNRVMANALGDGFDEYFQKLEGFCGQIENILKMIRYYYNIFS